ncbi:unnamed protein product, partial [Gulo gulo]
NPTFHPSLPCSLSAFSAVSVELHTPSILQESPLQFPEDLLEASEVTLERGGRNSLLGLTSPQP